MRARSRRADSGRMLDDTGSCSDEKSELMCAGVDDCPCVSIVVFSAASEDCRTALREEGRGRPLLWWCIVLLLRGGWL